jgi:electron transfer flavoprotein-quinone oxidoreductase
MPEKFNVVIVGAGPAGCTAAIVLARAGKKVAIFERGDQPGAKNMFGGALYYTRELDEILPDFWKEAPIERYVTRHVLTFLTPGSSFSVTSTDEEFGSPPYNGITLLRAKFDTWYAEKAQESGALLVPATVVDDLIRDGDKVTGVKTRRTDGEILADVVIAADGANSLLARKAGLRKDFTDSSFAVAAKEVLALPAETIEARLGLTEGEGLAQSFVGECTGGLTGGAFLYTNKSSLSLGMVVRLSSLREKKISITDLLDNFKNNPCIKPIIKDAVPKEYSGHLIPEAGMNMVPELCGNGIMVAGDAAGFLVSTGLTLQGMNFAIASGYAAAQAVIAAGRESNFSKEGLNKYRRLLEDSFVLKDLKTYHRAPAFQDNPRIYELYPSLICGISRRIYRVDGQPKKKILSLVRQEMKGKISLWRLFKDMIQAGRALLWP